MTRVVRYFHVAPSSARASIEAHGIDPGRFAASQGWTEYERYSDVGCFIFEGLDAARWYAEYMAGASPACPMDIWEISPTGWLDDDDGLVPGGSRAENAGSFHHVGAPTVVGLVATVNSNRY
jgi:hypothetical protein